MEGACQSTASPLDTHSGTETPHEEGPWKTVLDVWLDREDEGRGAAFSTRKVSDLVSSSTQRRSALPPFWKRAIEAIRELGVRPYSEEGTTTEDARAQPFFFNPQFEVRRNRVDWAFQSKLEMRRIADLLQEGNEHYWMPKANPYCSLCAPS